MCLPWEKTISGRVDNWQWRKLGFDGTYDLIGEQLKIGKHKEKKAPPPKPYEGASVNPSGDIGVQGNFNGLTIGGTTGGRV